MRKDDAAAQNYNFRPNFVFKVKRPSSHLITKSITCPDCQHCTVCLKMQAEGLTGHKAVAK